MADVLILPTPHLGKLDGDNVYLLRKAKRLPFDQRSVVAAVERQHKDFPISSDVVWAFTQQIQIFVDSAWYDADEALRRGSFL
jgi:hypothetical protein